MASKMPSDKKLEAALANTVKEIFCSDERDLLTVNYVREKVQEELGLDDGFFKEGAWKDKSKNIVKDTVAKLDSDEPLSSAANPKNSKTSQEDPERTATPTKRKRGAPAQAKEPAAKGRASKPPKKVESEELSEQDEDSEVEEPVEKRRRVTKAKPSSKAKPQDSAAEEDEDATPVKKKPAQRRKLAAKVESDDDDQTPKKKPAPRPRGKQFRKVVASDSEGEDNEPEADAETALSDFDQGTRKQASKEASKENEPDSPMSEVHDDEAESKSEDKPADDTDSEESIVYDEPPKRKRKGKGDAVKPAAKAAPKPRAKKASELTPDEEEIKKLQGHLVKCGVRKLWAVELKKYGDDTRAKIRHLREMLKDVGMEGRFSDDKARKIKEQRELAAELEAVQEMNEQWGKTGQGRVSRSRAARPKQPLVVQTFTDDSEEEEEEVEEDDDSDEDADEEESANDNSGDDDDDSDEGPPQKRGQAKRRAASTDEEDSD